MRTFSNALKINKYEGCFWKNSPFFLDIQNKLREHICALGVLVFGKVRIKLELNANRICPLYHIGLVFVDLVYITSELDRPKCIASLIHTGVIVIGDVGIGVIEGIFHNHTVANLYRIAGRMLGVGSFDQICIVFKCPILNPIEIQSLRPLLPKILE